MAREKSLTASEASTKPGLNRLMAMAREVVFKIPGPSRLMAMASEALKTPGLNRVVRTRSREGEDVYGLSERVDTK